MKRVSVVVPVYNQARFVAATLASLIGQSYPEVEVIVVNDGSEDELDSALGSYAAKIHRIDQPNKGLAGARNAGYGASSGEYLLFLDSDDTLAPDALARMASFLDTHAQYGAVYCAWQRVSEDGKTLLDEVRPGHEGNLLKKLLRREFFFFASGTMLRRSTLEQVGLFDEILRWGEDADLWLRLGLAGVLFGYLDQPLLRYRVHSSSMSASVSHRQFDLASAGLKKLFALPQLPPDVCALEAEAYSILHYETAGRYFRGHWLDDARQHLSEALRIFPAQTDEWILNWLAGTALDPRTQNPALFIDLVCQTLNELRPERPISVHRAHAHYHASAAFASHSSRQYRQVIRHWLPALSGDPSLVANKGFLSIGVRSFVKALWGK